MNYCNDKDLHDADVGPTEILLGHSPRFDGRPLCDSSRCTHLRIGVCPVLVSHLMAHGSDVGFLFSSHWSKFLSLWLKPYACGSLASFPMTECVPAPWQGKKNKMIHMWTNQCKPMFTNLIFDIAGRSTQVDLSNLVLDWTRSVLFAS